MLSLICTFLFLSVVAASDGKRRVVISYYADNKCSELGGLKQLVEGENYPFVTADKGANCLENLVCLHAPGSGECANVKKTEAPQKVGVIRDDDIIYENQNNELTPLKPSQCLASSVFTGCFFSYSSLEAIREDSHEALALAELENMKKPAANEPPHMVLAYFEDDDCEDLVSLRAFTSGEAYAQVGSVGRNCYEATNCESDLFSTDCARQRKTGVREWTTNAGPFSATDFLDGKKDGEYSYDECHKSGLYYARSGSYSGEPWLVDGVVKEKGWRNCYFRYIPMQMIAENPGTLNELPEDDN